MAGLGWAIPLNTFSGRERVQIVGEGLLSQTQLLPRGAEEAGDTPIHEGAGEAPERL